MIEAAEMQERSTHQRVSTAEGTGRVAVIAVHGIGGQGRYQTLDKVARGLEVSLAPTDIVMDYERTRELGQDLHSFVRLSRPDPDATLSPFSGARSIDVYEAYWQHRTKGFIRVRGVGRWLVFSLLSTVRLWSQLEVHNRSRLGRANRLVAEFLRLLVVPAAVVVGSLAALWVYGEYLTGKGGLLDELEAIKVDEILTEDTFWLIAEPALVLAALVLLIGGVFEVLIKPRLAKRGFRRWWRSVRTGNVMAREPDGLGRLIPSRSEEVWGRASLAFLVLVGLAIAFRLIGTGGKPRLWHVFSEKTSLFVSLLVVVGAWMMVRFIVGVVGDAALYLTDDPDSKAGEARRGISASVEDLLDAVLRHDDYDRVHIISHSLGTVIAYDALNALRIRDLDHYDKLGTFVTLACPLDQVAYYFRTKVGSDRSVRRRVLKFRHGLRQRPSDDEDVFIDGPPRFVWVNLFAWNDFIGGRLKGYKADHQRSLHIHPWPVTAHQAMWRKDKVYREIVKWL